MGEATDTRGRRTDRADEDDYKDGEMDIAEKEKTFDGFMRWSVNVAIVSIVIVIGLAIFAT